MLRSSIYLTSELHIEVCPERVVGHAGAELTAIDDAEGGVGRDGGREGEPPSDVHPVLSG